MYEPRCARGRAHPGVRPSPVAATSGSARELENFVPLECANLAAPEDVRTPECDRHRSQQCPYARGSWRISYRSNVRTSLRPRTGAPRSATVTGRSNVRPREGVGEFRTARMYEPHCARGRAHSGVRPSPVAATSARARELENFVPLECTNLAAPEDGRTPMTP